MGPGLVGGGALEGFCRLAELEIQPEAERTASGPIGCLFDHESRLLKLKELARVS